MFIRTKRLFLRPVFPEDWRDVYCGLGNQDTVRMLARAPWPYLPEHARTFCSLPTSPESMKFAITLPERAGAPVVGMIGMEPDPDENGEREIGYWIAPGFRGLGFASEALCGMIDTARALGIICVHAGHYLDNPASGAVLRRAGFVPTGEVRLTACTGRGGEKVQTRRYVLNLAGPAEPVAA